LTGILNDFVNEPDEYKDGYFRVIDEIAFHLQKDHEYTIVNTYIRICTIFGGLLGISGGGALGQAMGSLMLGMITGIVIGTAFGFFVGRMLERRIDREGKLL